MKIIDVMNLFWFLYFIDLNVRYLNNFLQDKKE